MHTLRRRCLSRNWVFWNHSSSQQSQKETGLKTLWSVMVFSHRSVLTYSRRNNVDESHWGLSKRGSIHVRMFPNNLPSWYKSVSFRRVKSAELQDYQLRHIDYRILSMWFTSVLPRMRKWTPTFRQKSQGNSICIHEREAQVKISLYYWNRLWQFIKHS